MLNNLQNYNTKRQDSFPLFPFLLYSQFSERISRKIYYPFGILRKFVTFALD